MTIKRIAVGLAVGGALVAALAFAPTLANASTSGSWFGAPASVGLEHRGGGGAQSLIAATVTVTGLTEQDVRTALQSGQTLTQIAESKGKTAAAVIAAARTTLEAALKQAVTDGKLTQAQADAQLASFDTSAPTWMTSTTLGQGGDGDRPGRGGGMGLRGGGAQSLIAATVTVTGLTEQDVRTALQSGQTLTQIAESKGKTAAAVIAAARTTLEAALKQAVTDGKLTQAQADAQLASFDTSAPTWMTSTTLGQGGDGDRPGRGGGMGLRGGGAQSLIAATVTVTGLTEQDVRTALQSGQTLTQIAESKGKTAAAVIAAARTTLEAALKQAVTDGKLTQAQADAQLASFDTSAPTWMTSATLGQRGGRGDFDGMGHGLNGAHSLIEATASVTGLTEQAVMTELQAGKTLTQIAEANGKTATAVIAAARTTLETALKQAVTDGKLTQAQADAQLTSFDTSTATWMTSALTLPGTGPNRHHGPGTQTDPTLPTTPTTVAPTSNS